MKTLEQREQERAQRFKPCIESCRLQNPLCPYFIVIDGTMYCLKEGGA